MTVYRTANLAWQLGGDARLLRELAENVDVLVLVECRDRDNEPVDVRGAIGVEWKVWQDLSSGARAGSVIAVHRDSGVRWRRIRPSRLSVLSPDGDDVQTRYLRTLRLRDDLGWCRIAAAHPPLESTKLQDDANRALAKWWRRTPGRKAAFGDGNRNHESLRDTLRAAHSAGRDVMFAIWSTGWGRVWVHATEDPATDHHILTFRTPQLPKETP